MGGRSRRTAEVSAAAPPIGSRPEEFFLQGVPPNMSEPLGARKREKARNPRKSAFWDPNRVLGLKMHFFVQNALLEPKWHFSGNRPQKVSIFH